MRIFRPGVSHLPHTIRLNGQAAPSVERIVHLFSQEEQAESFQPEKDAPFEIAMGRQAIRPFRCAPKGAIYAYWVPDSPLA